MDYFDEIQLEYNNFLAEQELFENLITLGSSVRRTSLQILLIFVSGFLVSPVISNKKLYLSSHNYAMLPFLILYLSTN